MGKWDKVTKEHMGQRHMEQGGKMGHGDERNKGINWDREAN